METKEKILANLKDEHEKKLFEEIYNAFLQDGGEGIKRVVNKEIEQIKKDFEKIKKQLENQMGG